MGEPIIGAQPLPGGELVVADQRPAVPVLPALQPAERTFRVVDDDGPANAFDLPLRAARSGPNEGALYRVIGAMTSIGISA